MPVSTKDLNLFQRFKLWFLRYWFFGLKKSICGLVIANLIFSLLTPALTYPLEINFEKINFKLGFKKAVTEELVFSILGALPAKAQDGGVVDWEAQIAEEYQQQEAAAAQAAAQAVETNDQGTQSAIQGTTESVDKTTKAVKTADKNEAKRQTWREKLQKLTDKLKNAVFIALKQGLSQMMNTLAYDVATWFASGGEGQQPMFLTEGWGAYLTNVADEAGGRFLESLGENWIGLNICNPSSLSLKVSLGLGLAHTQRPKAPECTITELVQNWEGLIQDANFLERFSPAFDPESNDIGIAFTVFNKSEEYKTKTLLAALKQREEDKGLIGKISRITGKILTPTVMIEGQAKSLSELKDPEWAKVQYGDIALDAVATFANTLVGKLFERLFKEGLLALKGGSSSGSNSAFSLPTFSFTNSNQSDEEIYLGDGGSQIFAGTQAASVRFLDFLQTGIFKQGPYDLLSKFTFCPDPSNPGPDECIIKPDFRVAIDKELTLAQAIDQGYIDGDAPFGFMDYDASSIYRGIPYRSIVILRAHRIVPAGWEIAAKAVNQYTKGKTYSLKTLISEGKNPDSLFYGLIDPNWVLKAPDHFCKAEGFGQNIVFEDISPGIDANNDGDYIDNGDTLPQRLIGRGEYCADFQSCIKENDDGSCKYYGYCSEERRVWNLEGTTCPDKFNTCQSFQNSSGQLVSYLKNSLEYNGCSIDNAGCRWYCQQYNPINNIWTCVNEGNRILKPCTQSEKICSVSLANCSTDSDCGSNGGKCIEGCKLSATCEVASGQTACSDQTSQVGLDISEPCSSGSKWWNQGSGLCQVSAGCVVPKRGVSCSTSSCDSLNNLLPNPSFETGVALLPTGPIYLFDKWSADAVSAVYFEKASGANEKIYLGNNSLRFFTYSSSQTATVTSDSFNLTAGTYTFSSQVFSRLNFGTATIKILDEDGNVLNSKSSSVKYDWERLVFDFTLPSNQTVKVQIEVSGGLISGAVWFDDFKITNSCVTNPITLTLVGTIDQTESKLHLDRDAANCSSENAGCTELIRTKLNYGTNIIPNSSFETWSDDSALRGWIGGVKQVTNDANNTNKAMVGNSSVLIPVTGGAGVKTFPLIAALPATVYYLSFWARIDSTTDYTAQDFVRLNWKEGAVNNNKQLEFFNSPDITLGSSWRRFVSDPTSTPINGTDFDIEFRGNSTNPVYIDGVQLEAIGSEGYYSTYKDYGLVNLTYLKKAPASLGCTGDYLNDPGKCNDYALYCSKEEVGCEAYTPVSGFGQTIPGVAALDDYCPAVCVGYEAYKQSTTYFENQEAIEYFIPKTAKSCAAVAEGCDEFTNLDKASKGGEDKEYYKYLRLCQKPDAPGAACQNYYTWQGSGETGYQLKVYNLSTGTNGPVEVIEYNGTETSWPDYWCGDKTPGDNGRPECCDGAEDLTSNSFCKQLYAVDGKVYYQIYPNTVTCSDNCLAYRKSRLGESEQVAIANCEGTHGVWDAASTACIYQAIPNEGLACAASEAGCREYRGNAGGNIFNAYENNFESATFSGWRYGQIDSEALSVGGHSLKSQYITESGISNNRLATIVGKLSSGTCNDRRYAVCSQTVTVNCFNPNLNKCIAEDLITHETCSVDINQEYCSPVNNVMGDNKTYLISFWAKSASAGLAENVQLQISTTTAALPLAVGTANISPDWNYYNFGPFVYQGGDQSAQLSLVGPSTRNVDFYIDNIKIIEVKNYTYVIKGSWQTPVSCDTNPFVDPTVSAPQFMLGCRQYSDFYNRIHNLKSFSRLCREQAAGCEALINTNNSQSPFEQVFNVGDATSQVKISADQIVYLVNRPAYQCEAQAKGCQALGQPVINYNDQVTDYKTIYKINNPDNYSSSLCSSAEIGCNEFQTGTGFSYFKDPGSKTCEYLPIPNQNTFGWFKTGTTATSTPDCPLIQPSLGQLHPGNGYVGLCSSEYSTCTQFIDPTTDYGKNLVFNGNLRPGIIRDLDINDYPDGWENRSINSSLPERVNLQKVSLKHDKLYTLTVTGTSSYRAYGQPWIEIANCPGITSFDHSLVSVCVNADGFAAEVGGAPKMCAADSDCLSSQKCGGNILALPWQQQDTRTSADIANLPEERQYSGRFFVPNRDQVCRLIVHSSYSFGINNAATKVNEFINEIKITPTDVSYVLENTVDKLSCNGVVNNEEGCVLFNNRAAVNYKLGEDDTSYLTFDADASDPGVNHGVAVSQCSGVCDSNAILKVKPDRICDSWLYCSSYATLKAGEESERNECTSIGLCSSLDDNGNCNDFAPLKKGTDRKSYYETTEEIKNLSGYTKAGLNFDNQLRKS
ncbi:MAG: hypothetical protein WCW26_03255, partial [Candidatus Buchananbacteria bacterium]